jgi:hypothetical protein
LRVCRPHGAGSALGADEASDGHLSVMAYYGNPIPTPPIINGIEAAVGSVEVGRFLVRAERPGKAVRVQVSIEEGLLARIDRAARNRSCFLADAARASLGARNALRCAAGKRPALQLKS